MAANSANETNGNGMATRNMAREEKQHLTFAGTAYYISPKCNDGCEECQCHPVHVGHWTYIQSIAKAQ